MIAAPGTGQLICPLFDAILKSPSSGPISQQYASAATVPLIKSPSLWLPKPVCAFRGIVTLQLMEIQVELPNDIHPLPEDITAYVSPLPARTPVLNARTVRLPLLARRARPLPPAPTTRSHSPTTSTERCDPAPTRGGGGTARVGQICSSSGHADGRYRRQELHRVAPGYNPSSLLMPISASPAAQPAPGSLIQPMSANVPTSPPGQTGGQDLMDDLVSGLEQMESRR